MIDIENKLQNDVIERGKKVMSAKGLGVFPREVEMTSDMETRSSRGVF